MHLTHRNTTHVIQARYGTPLPIQACHLERIRDSQRHFFALLESGGEIEFWLRREHREFFIDLERQRGIIIELTPSGILPELSDMQIIGIQASFDPVVFVDVLTRRPTFRR